MIPFIDNQGYQVSQGADRHQNLRSGEGGKSSKIPLEGTLLLFLL